MEQQIKKYKRIYPIILVNTKLGIMRIINQNSTTSFRIESHETKSFLDKQMDNWTPEKEVILGIESGFHRVHDTDAERWEIWDAGKGIK